MNNMLLKVTDRQHYKFLFMHSNKKTPPKQTEQKHYYKQANASPQSHISVF